MPRNHPDWVTGFLTLTENLESSELYRVWAGMSTVAACLKRKCSLRWLAFNEFYPNLYILLVGPSGARKGEALTAAKWFLSEKGIAISSQSVTREALIDSLVSCIDQDIIINPKNTDEGDLALHHCSLTVFSEEFTVFLGYNNVQLISDLCDWFDGTSPWTYRTRGRGEETIRNVWVNLIGATTPSTLRSALPSDAIGGGLTSRMMLVYASKPDKAVVYPRLTAKQLELRTQLLEDLDEISTLGGYFETDRTFNSRWEQWYPHQVENPPFQDPNFEGYMSRRQVHVIKSAMVLCASRTDDMILTSADFDRALALVERTETLMPFVYRGYGADVMAPVQAKVMTILQQQNGQMMEVRELHRLILHDVGTKESFTALVEALCHVGFCTIIDKGDKVYIQYNKKQ